MSVQGYQLLETAPFHIIAVQRNHELKEQLEKHNTEMEHLIETQADRRSSEWIQDVKNHTTMSARLLQIAEKTDGLSRETLDLVDKVRLNTNTLEQKLKEISRSYQAISTACGCVLIIGWITIVALSAKYLD